ncbi:hypothetical protein [Actinomadura chokoriensis]|uniref:Tryptophan-rich sensory protein n=1 Tax=Actinomadura chokoriensis TaxID=454156 RepID=A0ABV4R8S7_9ACTN
MLTTVFAGVTGVGLVQRRPGRTDTQAGSNWYLAYPVLHSVWLLSVGSFWTEWRTLFWV